MKPLLRRFCRCSDVVSSHRAALPLLHIQPSSLLVGSSCEGRERPTAKPAGQGKCGVATGDSDAGKALLPVLLSTIDIRNRRAYYIYVLCTTPFFLSAFSTSALCTSVPCEHNLVVVPRTVLFSHRQWGEKMKGIFEKVHGERYCGLLF